MTDDNEDICGVETATGDPCQRPAGWGTDSDIGPCKTHDPSLTTETGRPSKFDDVVENLLDAADSPKNMRQVANAAGIHEDTLYRWLNEREEFSESFKRARARAADRLIQRALDPSDEIDRGFARFLLERSFQFIKTERHEHAVSEEPDLSDKAFEFQYE